MPDEPAAAAAGRALDRADAGARGPDPRTAPVRSAVAAHHPGDEREAAARARILEELDRWERPFHEDAQPVHVTGSAVVVGRRGMVLHRHKRLGRWMQPGGHVDPGETPADAALREAQEETGLHLAHPAGGPRLLHVDVHDAAGGHVHLDLRYLLVGPDDDPAPPPGESPEARWFAWDDAMSVADGALAGALRAARRQSEALGAPAGAAHTVPEVRR